MKIPRIYVTQKGGHGDEGAATMAEGWIFQRNAEMQRARGKAQGGKLDGGICGFELMRILTTNGTSFHEWEAAARQMMGSKRFVFIREIRG